MKTMPIDSYLRWLPIAQGQDIDYDDASGGIDFDANGDVTSGTSQVWKIEDGQFVDAGLLTFP